MIPWWVAACTGVVGIVFGFALFYAFEHWTYGGWTE